jgi:hypothetical protein
MSRATTALAAVGLLIAATGAAMAQDRGGVGMRRSSPEAVMDRIQSVDPGCKLSQTNVAIGVNRALNTGAAAQQQVTSVNKGCRPLVSTQVAAGVNLSLGRNSVADQTIEARGPRGLLSTTNVARGANIAGGRGSLAGQRIISVTGR